MFEDVKSYKEIIKDTLGHAMIASMGYSKQIYRHKFDISLPVMSNLLKNIQYDVRIYR